MIKRTPPPSLSPHDEKGSATFKHFFDDPFYFSNFFDCSCGLFFFFAANKLTDLVSIFL
jgi:hypothetical protein